MQLLHHLATKFSFNISTWYELGHHLKKNGLRHKRTNCGIHAEISFFCLINGEATQLQFGRKAKLDDFRRKATRRVEVHGRPKSQFGKENLIGRFPKESRPKG